jgi:hypothetical protein
MNKLFSHISYAIRLRKATVFFVLILTALLVYDWLTGWSTLDTLKTSWDDEISQLVTFATFVVAIAVWFAELTQEWRNNLPKRLTVEFVYYIDDEAITVMRCEKAHLSDTADIRALGQQIGSQLVDPDSPKQLSFRAPYVTQDEGITEHENEVGFIRHYNVVFTLTSLPEGVNTTECKTWVEPFDKNSISICQHQ